MDLLDAERSLGILVQRLEQSSTVRSPYPGRVLEIKMRPGDVVSRGDPLFEILVEPLESQRADLEKEVQAENEGQCVDEIGR